MRSSSFLLLVAIAAWAAAACTDVPIDDDRNDKRLIPARGVIRGTVTYTGPRPCSKAGHVVGNAVMLVFDTRNMPPPIGVATSAVNFVAVPGDVLFANEPRATGKALYCPPEDETITASAPFTVGPLDGASYAISAFYDRRGRFFPTLSFRDLPEAGDVEGGAIDVPDALAHAGDVNHVPKFTPIAVGVPSSKDPSTFVIPSQGYLADDVAVTIGQVVPFARPVFHVDGAEVIDAENRQTSDANAFGDPTAVPIVAMPQDVQVLAPPKTPSAASLAALQKSFVSLALKWGVPDDELDPATDPGGPFDLQIPSLPPDGKGGLVVFGSGARLPDNPSLPFLWPSAALVKLVDEDTSSDHRRGPESLVVQGTAAETSLTGKPPGPLVVIQGITLLDDSIGATALGPIATAPSTASLRDHVTVLVRPAALCYDPRRVDAGPLLVAPHLTGPTADSQGDAPLFDADGVIANTNVQDVKVGCLPKGRYAISLVYPTGQAWTTPNETGLCGPADGPIAASPGKDVACAKPRPLLLSQGARAVLEIVAPSDPSACDATPVPDACLRVP